MNSSMTEFKKIFIKYPDVIIEKIYYYYYTPLSYKIQKNIINYKFYKNIKENTKYHSMYSYVNYIPITYYFEY